MADTKHSHSSFVFREGYVLKGKLNPNAKPPQGGSVFSSAKPSHSKPADAAKKPVSSKG